MTGTVCWPLEFTLPPGATIQDKKDALRRFGDEVIRPTNA